MGTISEHSYWEPEIYSLETNDLIAGGPDGVDNKPHWGLANRTLYLKDKLEELSVEVGNDLQQQLKTLSASISNGDNELAAQAQQIRVNAAALTTKVAMLEDSMTTGDAELASQIQQLHVSDDTLLSKVNALELKHNEIFDGTGHLTIEAMPEVIQHNRGSYPSEEFFPDTANDGDFAVNMETNTVWIWDISNKKWINSGNNSAVTTVNSKMGDVVITIDDIATLRATLDALNVSAESHDTSIADHTKQLATIDKNVATNASDIAELQKGSESTYKEVTVLVDVAMPLGTVVMFSGDFGGDGNRFPIPLGAEEPNTNWVLCDGTETDGFKVPDLRNRMIIGAGGNYNAGATGGSTAHSHSVSGYVHNTTLATWQMPSHNHYMTCGGQSVYATFDTGHHAWPSNYSSNGAKYTGNTGGNGAHGHGLTINNTSTSSNLPPYYALAYIMRIH